MSNMASLIGFTILILSSLPISNAYATRLGPVTENQWFQNICRGNEKVAKVHFYVHDILAGENITVYEVARASITSNSSTVFGLVLVLDDKLTAEPDFDSQELGRIQGLVTSADLATTAAAMNLNVVFTSGEYSGSTISILGRNQIMNEQRELPVVGGTGVFRFARGYAILSTYSLDAEHVVVEFTLYVTYVDGSSSSM